MTAGLALEGLLHPAVQKLPRFLVVKLGDHGVEQVNEVGAAPGALGAQLFDAGLEVVQLGLVVVRLVLDDAEVLEAGHVQGLVVGVEFLEVLFSGGVAGEEVYRPLALGLEFGNAGTGFVLGRAVDGFIACAFKVAFCYLAEGDEIQTLVELGKKDVPVVAQEAGAQAQFARFLGGNEVAAHVVGSGEGLVLLHAAVEAIDGSGRAPTCGRVGLYAASPRFAAGFTLRSLTWHIDIFR